MKALSKTFIPAAVFNIFLLTALFIIILIVNSPVISFDMIYFEQSTIYDVNQRISSLMDLLNVYLHPKMLQINIPFFRPSGHFLLYQLLMPFLGWHNTKGLIVVNLFFLALAGLCIIKLYSALFPRYKVGGFIALSIYVMHPLLNAARLTIMHFEFAYVFFTLLTLYLFVRFCLKNTGLRITDIANIQLRHLHMLVISLVFFVLAVTFKESAVMAGPVMVCYLCIHFYTGQNILKYMAALCANKQIRKIVILITVMTFTMAVYLTLPWPSTTSHPLWSINLIHSISAANAFIRYLFSFEFNLLPYGDLPGPLLALRRILFPPAVSYLLWGLLAILLISPLLLRTNKSADYTHYKKSLFFLLVAAVLFLLLPLLWGWGLPWHLSLTLACVSMMMGFSVEYLCHHFFKQKHWINSFCMLFGVGIVMLTIPVNKLNIHDLKTYKPNYYFALNLNRNAISSPPVIKSKLNQSSVLIIEDSIFINDYSIGNALYPYLLSTFAHGLKYVLEHQNSFSTQQDIVYNGALFRWAYLMPNLREEVYPFKVDQMKLLPDEIIHGWLQNYDNIFCLGYDAKANWLDKTTVFKKNLLEEQAKRRIVVNSYKVQLATVLGGTFYNALNLPYPDPQLCQFRCDQESFCRGFDYIYTMFNNHRYIQCKFYIAIAASDKSCSDCTGYIKVA